MEYSSPAITIEYPQPPQHSALVEEVRTTLDEIFVILERGNVQTGMVALFHVLKHWRDNTSTEVWHELVDQHCLKHPIAKLIFQCPLALHSYSQPRGYPGDAELLDYIYGVKPCSDAATPVGRAIHEFLFNTQAANAGRARREILADYLDQTARQVTSPRILSIAAGHLREAELSTAVTSGAMGEYVALDQDEQSLEQIDRDLGRHGVSTLRGSVRELLKGEQLFGDFDFVYAAGLYDYLSDKAASGLTAMMFHALKPGGRLLVANVLPDIDDVGFIESYLGWELIYRTPGQLFRASDQVPLDEVGDIRVFAEPNQVFLFLEIKKRA